MNGPKGAIDAQGALACSSDGLFEDIQTFANHFVSSFMRLNVSAIKGRGGVDQVSSVSNQ
jgi:hypothetical protein